MENINSASATRKVSYIVSIWREATQGCSLGWKVNLETAAGQHLTFTSLAELNRLLCELGGWIDPPAESAAFIPPND